LAARPTLQSGSNPALDVGAASPPTALAAASVAYLDYDHLSLWLESVEQILGERTLLLGLDEFESLCHAVNNGWLDERVLGFLRNLSQHHTQVDLLLAGSHRPEEIDETWSSYLIGATVIEIAYLDPSETRRLIECPIPGFGLRYQPAAVDHIIQLTRCQPLLVQLLGQELVHLLNERGEREAGIAEIEAVAPRALQFALFRLSAQIRCRSAGRRHVAHPRPARPRRDDDDRRPYRSAARVHRGPHTPLSA